MADYYDVLGVNHDASLAHIRAAYNHLVLQAHPDKGGSHERFIELQAAWETLRDPAARAKYDNELARSSRQQKKNQHQSPKEEERGNPRQAPHPPHHQSNFGNFEHRDSTRNNNRGGSRRGGHPSGNSGWYSRPSAGEDTTNSNFRHGARDPPNTFGQSWWQSTSHRQHDSFPFPRSSPEPDLPSLLKLDQIKELKKAASSHRTRFQSLQNMLQHVVRRDDFSTDFWLDLAVFDLILGHREVNLAIKSCLILCYMIDRNSGPLPHFDVSEWERQVKEDLTNVNELATAMTKVMTARCDLDQRRETAAQQQGMEVDDDEDLRKLERACVALKRLLVRILDAWLKQSQKEKEANTNA